MSSSERCQGVRVREGKNQLQEGNDSMGTGTLHSPHGTPTRGKDSVPGKQHTALFTA